MAVSNNPFLNAELQQINMQPQPAFGALGNWLSDTLRGDEPLPTTGGWKGHGAAPVRPDTAAGEAVFDAGIHDMFQGELAFNKPFEDAEAEGAYGVPSTGRDLGQKYPVAQQTGAAVKSTKPPVEPGVIAPDPGMDPAGNLAAKNANIAAGAGNVHGQVKPAPDTSLADARAAIFKDLGQQVSFNNEELEPWYESPTFYRGLISFGLNLLSGNDLGSSFNQAGRYYDYERGREKRELWRDDLIEHGYDPIAVERYIETGDNKDLPDPMEKAKQMADYERVQLALAKDKYEMDPEHLSKKEAREEEEWKMKVEKHKQDLLQGAASIRASDALATKRGEDEEAGGTGSDFNAKAMPKGQWAQNYKFQSDTARGDMQDYISTFGGSFSGQLDDRTVLKQAFDRSGLDPKNKLDVIGLQTLISYADPQLQSRLTQQLAVLTPLLRLDSGATINASEYVNKVMSRFPQLGDTPEQAGKKKLRIISEIERRNPVASDKLIETMAKIGSATDAEYTPDGSLLVYFKDRIEEFR